MLQQVLTNLLSDIAIVQRYLEVSQDAGFADMTRLLESLAIHLFKASHGLDLTNKNLFAPNFPAIDLADEAKRVAIQVTVNADAKKIRHTLAKFDEYNLAKDYDSLIIHGFLNCSRIEVPDHCTVINIGTIVSTVADKNDEELAQHLVDALEQHTDFSRIHPYDDRNCLEIVLRCIDRNALKHRMVCEGSYRDMVKGLNEITELISKGTINRKKKNKSVDDFNDSEIQIFLTTVRNEIGRIVAIVNESRQGGLNLLRFPCIRFSKSTE
ncbi:SMEK domain-containing protein [Gimesia sp.]|uniref:SMEK domain-containing protein n=1 Tax=Gimesia sp. TaxID=2024833 RepID=UPI000C63940F|nr:SMEK domain-containing protein [Gimesia sp.]MAX39834.1 regulator [Gimesia sp.]HAH49306.1 regulator [Planctomycetaceae bacterium]HBL45874.1 regulator [Planctomycetaceae bacterium]|tara:strand:+ start:7355 stop:8158 length:804 start_codon:yes stop_codon:yes gene_type:complete